MFCRSHAVAGTGEQSTIHYQIRPCDEAGFIAAQNQNGIGDDFWWQKSWQALHSANPFLPCAPVGVIALDHLLQSGSFYRAGTDRDHTDIRPSILNCEGTREH